MSSLQDRVDALVKAGKPIIKQDIFADKVRGSIFNGKLAQTQWDGMSEILRSGKEYGILDARWHAYALATAFHETAHTMQPIKEYGRGKGKKYGAVDPKTKQVYYGRGYVQLTWKFNYEAMSQICKHDFVNHPDDVMQPHYAAQILWVGMRDGTFTGKAFKNYFNADKTDPVNARRIINGTDKAELIAGYYRKFMAAFEASVR